MVERPSYALAVEALLRSRVLSPTALVTGNPNRFRATSDDGRLLAGQIGRHRCGQSHYEFGLPAIRVPAFLHMADFVRDIAP